mmetsp:Transcript_9561/g.18630  ORF Transcript_9561/g.18630 Transcript_9561/m.18630 type:complete len:145 (+) Transcript_9561:276-710(+)
MAWSRPMWYLLVLFTIFSDIEKYFRNHKDWVSCAYPVDLWYCIASSGSTFCFGLNLVTIFHYRRVAQLIRAKICLVVLTPVVQILLFVWLIIGTVWVGLTMHEDSECVRHKQIPVKNYSLVFDVIGLYLLWAVVSCSTGLSVSI